MKTLFVISLVFFSGWLSGCRLGKPTPQASLSPDAQLQANAQLLHEMFRIVLLREPLSETEFMNYLNPLSQGGSLEGLYNGFVHTDRYFETEKHTPPSTPKALKVFSEQLTSLEQELPKPTDFEITGPPSAKKYEKKFQGASIFTLKRVLGDEALRVAEAKTDRDAFATWYAHWTVELIDLGVGFGTPLRDKADFEFHRNWALKASRDRAYWELLNRVHRLLNAANLAQGTS